MGHLAMQYVGNSISRTDSALLALVFALLCWRENPTHSFASELGCEVIVLPRSNSEKDEVEGSEAPYPVLANKGRQSRGISRSSGTPSPDSSSRRPCHPDGGPRRPFAHPASDDSPHRRASSFDYLAHRLWNDRLAPQIRRGSPKAASGYWRHEIRVPWAHRPGLRRLCTVPCTDKCSSFAARHGIKPIIEEMSPIDSRWSRGIDEEPRRREDAGSG